MSQARWQEITLLKALCVLFFGLGLHGIAAEAPPLVTLEAAPTVILKPGEKKQATVSVVVKEGYHIQANPASERMIPTELKFEKAEGMNVGTILYPACDPKMEKALGPCKPHHLKGFPKAISTYEGSVRMEFFITADKKVNPGKHTLAGKLRYQACNAHTCFFPKSIDVAVPIEVGSKS